MDLNHMIDEQDDDTIPNLKVKYREKLYETEKAWKLMMLNTTEHWFPKSHCYIYEDFINIPSWLYYKMNLIGGY
jgi:hypothetical protein